MDDVIGGSQAGAGEVGIWQAVAVREGLRQRPRARGDVCDHSTRTEITCRSDGGGWLQPTLPGHLLALILEHGCPGEVTQLQI